MAQNNLPEKILIVDSDPTTAGGLKEPLAKYGIKVVGATDIDTALYLFNQNRFDVVCIEMAFEAMPGLVLVQKWRNHEMPERRHTGFILLTGNRGDHDPGLTRLVQELRDIEILAKPVTAIQLLPVLSRAKATKMRAIKYAELQQTALKLGESKDRLDKALGMIQKQLPELGVKGMEMMIDLYCKHDQFDPALALVNPLLEKDGNNVQLINKKGQILLKMGRHQEALQYLEKADVAAPDQLDRITSLASAYLADDKPDQAVNKMRQLINYHPEDEDLKFDMFAQLQNHGYNDHALKLCKETTTPIEVVRYYNNKGIALKNTGKIEQALEEYDRSLRYYPNFKENYRIHYNIALAQVSFKKVQSYKIALESLGECLRLEPKFVKAKNLKDQVEKALSSKGKKSQKKKQSDDKSSA